MIELLSIPFVLLINAFITGIFTKLADAGIEHGIRMPTYHKILFGILWGLFASFVVFGSALLAAFYLGIVLSWIVRYKLDYYNHGVGGAMVLFSIFLVHPNEQIHYIIIGGTFLLFTVFGFLSRELKLTKKLGWFHEYNIYSFLFLFVLSIIYTQVWIVFFASLTNVMGYHAIKKLTKKKGSKKVVSKQRK